MPINPATGLEDSNYKEDRFGLPDVVSNANLIASRIGQVYNPVTGQYERKPFFSANVEERKTFFPGPTVATKENPMIDKEKVGIATPEPIALTRDNFVNIISKDPAKLTEQDKELIRKVQARKSLGEDLGTIFGETATTTTPTITAPPAPTSDEAISKRKGELATQTADLVSKKQAELDANLAKRRSELEALGEKQKQAAQSVLSSSGFGRSTTAATQMSDIQKNVNDMIAAEQARNAQEIAIFKAQQEGANSETIAGMQKQLDTYNQNVQTLEFNAANETAKMNAANKVKGQEALDNFLSVLTGDSKTKLAQEGYDEKLSSKLGYAVDKFGKALMIDGKKLEFTGEAGVSDAIESYASEIFKGNANISSVPDDKRDAVINRVAGMRSENKTSTSSVSEFRAEKILKTILKRQIDKQKDAAYMGFVSNMLDKGYSEDQIYNELGSADLKKTDFVAGNQKLFDDMQKDTKDFSDMRSSFMNMNAVVKDAIASNDEKSKASADQALITLFNKMLDPGSVVREGEYDRTSQGQSVLSQADGYLNRLMQGGAAITDDTRKDMVRIAEILYKQAEKGIGIRKNTYGQIASDVGGDPKFVDRYFDGQLQSNAKKFETDQEEFSQIKGIFGGGTTTQSTGAKEFKSSSGKSFKINFSKPEQSGSTTGLDLRSVASKYPNEASVKNNNPAGITYNQTFADRLTKEGILFDKGTARPADEGGYYFTFPNIDEGIKAYHLLWNSPSYTNLTVGQALKRWGTGALAGVNTSKKVSELTDKEKRTLQMNQIKKESPGMYKELINNDITI